MVFQSFDECTARVKLESTDFRECNTYKHRKKLIKGHYISFGPLHKAVETKWRQSDVVSSPQYLLKTTKNPTAVRSWAWIVICQICRQTIPKKTSHLSEGSLLGSYQSWRIHVRLLSELKVSYQPLSKWLSSEVKDPFGALIRTEGFVLDPFQLALIRTEWSMSGSYQNWRIHIGLLSELKDPSRALLRTEGFILAPFQLVLIRI